MEQEVTIVDLVKIALGIKETGVALELFAALEGVGQLVDDGVLFRGEGIGILGIHGGEVGIFQRIGDIANGDALILIIDLVQKETVTHAKLGPADQFLTFQLEEDDGDGLVHPCGEQLILLADAHCVIAGELDLEAGGVAVFIDLVGKDGEGTQRDTVAGLDDLQIVVMERVGKHRGYQCAAAAGSTHPENVMVAPLDVHAVVIHQRVHHDIGAGTAVENIAHQMQVIHGKTLDHAADGDDDVGRLTDVDDGFDDGFKIVLLVIPIAGMDQLVDHVSVFLGQGFAHLGTGIFGAEMAAQLHQTIEGDAVPLFGGNAAFLQFLQFFLRVIDQRGQLGTLGAGKRSGIQVIQFVADNAGTGIEDMKKGLVLTVDIRNKMLGALGEVHDSLKIDDLGACGLHSRILSGKHIQIAKFLRSEAGVHGKTSLG